MSTDIVEELDHKIFNTRKLLANPDAELIIYLGKYQIIQLRSILSSACFTGPHLKEDNILGIPFIRVTKWDYLAIHVKDTK